MSQKTKSPSFHISDKLWDLWCIVSVLGIWPRFIEPNLLTTTPITLPVLNLPEELKGLKILQFSDLHINSRLSKNFLHKLQRKITGLKPDIIVFTGDFLSCSELEEDSKLKEFLKTLEAPYGCFAILGNHDYEAPVTINEKGDYDLSNPHASMIKKGFQRLFSSNALTGKVSPSVRKLSAHKGLLKLLKETPFELLDNKTKTLKIYETGLNITGLGEYMLGQCHPEKAFLEYNENYVGIVLAHNPDSIPLIEKYPGAVILCGHTHGAQVNLPWMWKKFIILENIQYKRGLFKLKNKWAYVNRGIGSVMPFRWFSLPEILLLTLS